MINNSCKNKQNIVKLIIEGSDDMEMKKTLLSIGLNREYLNNPAFDLIINDLEKIIKQMNNKDIKPVGNSIYLDNNGINITISIENGNIKYLLDKYKEEITEVEITIKNEIITLQTNYAMIGNADLPLNKCSITNSVSKEKYNEYGIMINKEYKLYKPRIINHPQDDLSLTEILQPSREAFYEESSYNNSYMYREYAQRMQIDIAKIYIVDKVNSKEYASEILLENNYQKMNIDIKDYGEKEIEPLTIDQIEEKIKTEHNPKVQEGLRKLSKSRDSYEYKSLKDPNFISKGYGYSRSFLTRQKQKVMTLSIIVVLFLITIIYAIFTQNLNTKGTGINRKSNFDIYFNNVSDFQTTGTASVVTPNPKAREHTTIIEDYEATLITPSDSIYFTFDIVNDGDYDATLTSLTLGPVKCSVNGDETDTSARNVCENIEYTMKYTDNNQNVSTNDKLLSKETKNVKVTLTYKDTITADKLPTSNVSISNLGIELVYEADNQAKTNNDGSTPYQKPTAVSTLLSKVNDASATYTSGSEASHQMYTFEHPATEQTGSLTDYRYIGSDPYNYVDFNGEIWRIIGIFEVEDENGNKKQRIKIIKDEKLTNNMIFDSKGEYGINDWSNANINLYLNNDYYNLFDNNAKNIISNSKYYLGSIPYVSSDFIAPASEIYVHEKSQIVSAGHSINWNGFVGLLYVSDYLYTFANGVDDTCYNNGGKCYPNAGGVPTNSWLYKYGITYWSITPSEESYMQYFISSSGYTDCNKLPKNKSSIFPVLYLNEDVLFEGNHTGSSSDHYQLKK